MSTSKNTLPKHIYTLGPQGSFHHRSLLHYLNGRAVDILFKENFKKLFEAVKNDDLGAGWCAAENSLTGLVEKNLEVIKASFTAMDTLRFKIKLAFAAKRKTDLQTVYTHPKAWEEAGDVVLEQYPDIAYKATQSTSEAAKIASESPEGAAAICHPDTAKALGLRVFTEDLLPDSNNYTTFIFFKKIV
jgi:prephenate dehydratase